MTGLAELYRPRTLEQVVGQKHAVEALRETLKHGTAHAFLLSGPSGVGKTTLARIAVSMLEAEKVDINGAECNGIDNMRELQHRIGFKPFEHECRVIIMDEAHRVTKPAWDCSLKMVEEPPDHVYWMLCTTEPEKLPTTIRNRCVELKLGPVPVRHIEMLLEDIARREGREFELGVLELCAQEAGGSPRKAINHMAMSYGKDRAQVHQMLREREESQPISALCKMLLNGGGTWLRALPILANMPTDDAEIQRVAICNYLAKALRDKRTNEAAKHVIDILEQFSQPYHPGEKQAPLLLSVGRVLLKKTKPTASDDDDDDFQEQWTAKPLV